jgi:DtxR family Mn-dependent transcriptional regulator
MRNMVAPARTETVDHYLETIYYIEHEGELARPSRLAEWLGVSAPTVSASLARLARDGWITVAPDRHVSLTAQGETAAEGIVRRHRLIERWLTDRLGMDWTSADEQAQRMAGNLTDEVANRLDEHLGFPPTCPHGNVIPGRDAPYGTLVALGDLEPGTFAIVRRISEVAEHDAPQLLRQLDANGLVTGAHVRIADGDTGAGALPVEVAGRTMALGTAVARLIWVEEVEEEA